MRYFSELAGLVVIVLLAGCGTVVEDHAFAGYSSAPLNDDSIKPYETLLTKLSGGTPPLVARECFFVIEAAKGDELQKKRANCTIQRNQAVAILTMSSRQLCVKHLNTIYGRDAATNITFGTLTNIFAGAAAVAGTQGAQTLFGALALFSNSERSLINETIYKQMIVTSVDQKITEVTTAKGNAIVQASNASIEKYTMQQALNDVIDLHTSCSFTNGLRLTLAEGTRASNLRKIVALRQSLNAIELQRSASCPESKKKEEFCKQLDLRTIAVSTALITLESSPD